MKKTINVYDFIESFKKMNRGNQFTRNGLIALFGYLERYEEETEMDMDLDVIALCCEFTEYDLAEFKADYPDVYYQAVDAIFNDAMYNEVTDPERIDFVETELTVDELMSSLETELSDETEFIKVTEDSFIIRNF